MKAIWVTPSISFVAFCLIAISTTQAAGPLPKFTFKGVALEAKNLNYGPQGLLERACLVDMEGRVPKPLGKYYLYYSPHKPFGIGLVYSDNIEGPWTEYKDNPVIEHAAIPEVHWIPETGKFHLWAYSKRAQTDMWTSDDGLHFVHHSTSITGKNIGTRNATYTRVYEYPLERYGSKYIMLYSGFDEARELRYVWLAHSKDATTWTQVKTPLVAPAKGEGDDIYGPSLFRWKGKNFIVYQDHTAYRGGNVKYVELDKQLNPVGNRGERHVLIDPVPDSPIDNRYRECEFYRDGNTLYMYSSGAENPRRIVFATATIGDDAATDEAEPQTAVKHQADGGQAKKKEKERGKEESRPVPPSADENAQ